MPRDTRAAFLEAITPRLNQIEAALLEAFLDMNSSAAQTTIERIIADFGDHRDVERAVQDLRAAINFGARGFFAPLDRSLEDVFTVGGVYQLSRLPKMISNTAPRLVVRFDGRRPEAERFTRQQAARLITEITTETEQVIRQTLTEAIEENRSYRRIAQDLIGRMDGNRRKGGLIGLHSRQAQAVRAARRDLEDLNVRYFTRSPRDRRFDATVRKAIREGRRLTVSEVDKITGRYADRLLQLRAKTVARTEGNKAANAGRSQGIAQMIEDGDILPQHVTIFWDAVVGPRTRDSHLALNGSQIGWGEVFVSPVTGVAMRWPHDENAPARETANCRCSARFRIDWAAVARWREERFAA